MIELPVKPGSPEWIVVRIGISIASNFDRILTPKTLKPSASSGRYIAELCAEWLLGASLDEGTTQWMERGTDLEAGARRYYELQRGHDVRPAGFCLSDDRTYGCTPDGLVDPDGGLEIKCPSPVVHVMHLLGHPADEYRAQVQGCLMVTGRQWWDFLSFHPELPPALVRVERDEPFMEALADCLADFLLRLGEAKHRLRELGCKPASETRPPPDDGTALFASPTPEQVRLAGRFKDAVETPRMSAAESRSGTRT